MDEKKHELSIAKGDENDAQVQRFVELAQRYFATVETEAPSKELIAIQGIEIGPQLAFSYEPDLGAAAARDRARRMQDQETLIEDCDASSAEGVMAQAVRERQARAPLTSEIDALNRECFFQALMPIPIYCGLLMGLELWLICVSRAAGNGMLLLFGLVTLISSMTVLFLALFSSQLKKFDIKCPILSSVLPDQVIVSTNGIILRWLGFLSFSSWPLLWDEMALVYVEGTEVGERLLCIRNKRGGVLRLREDAFGTPEEFIALKEIISQRAALAVKQRSSALLAQPEQRLQISYVVTWFWQLIFNRQYDGAPDSANAGDLLHGKYRIVESLGNDGISNLYLAEVEDRSAAAHCVLIETAGDKGHKLDIPQVMVREYYIPRVLNPWKLMGLLTQIEESSRGRTLVSGRGLAYWIDHFIVGPKFYAVFERVNGTSLATIISEGGPMAEGQALEFGTELAEIVSCMHNRMVLDMRSGKHELRPLVHGRISPPFLVRDQQKRVRITECPQMTEIFCGRHHTILGDKRYLAPEQLWGTATVQSDVYAIGRCLHFVLKGAHPEPFKQSILPEEAASEKMRAIIEKATNLNVWERYSDVDDLVSDLRALRGEEHP